MDESWNAGSSRNPRTKDPWLMIVACRMGQFSLHGGRTLAAKTKVGRTNQKLRALTGVRIFTDGDDGATVPFDIDSFGDVARVLKPRRRCRLRPKQRRACTEHLAIPRHESQQRMVLPRSVRRPGPHEQR